jgi:hypothetical protein
MQEGVPTVALGIWIWYTLAPCPQEARFLTQVERDYVSKIVHQNKVRTPLSQPNSHALDWKVCTYYLVASNE